jgi:D-glycero-D-manno-heptose 1,7-bisphosphate phosphatase
MILAAAHDLNLDLSASVFIGDQPSDIEAGRAAGIAEDRMLMIGRSPLDLTNLVVAALSSTRGD